MAHRLAPQAERDLDAIGLYVAKESGSLNIANGLIDEIVERFWLLAEFPYIGRSRENDLGASRRSLAVGEYVIIYRVESESVLILRVVHGRRDLETLFDR
jgi:toxin ParE1/3/4